MVRLASAFVTSPVENYGYQAPLHQKGCDPCVLAFAIFPDLGRENRFRARETCPLHYGTMRFAGRADRRETACLG